MTAPVFTQLGGSTLARKWVYEVNTAYPGGTTFVPIGGVTNSVFKPDAPNMADDSDMNSGGAGSQTKTAGQASIALTVSRKPIAATPTLYDVGQEYLRAKGINVYGSSNTVQIRISEFDPAGGPRVEAYLGLFAVGWDPQGGSNTSLDTVNLELQGQGRCVAITHPYPAVAAVPTVVSVTPATLVHAVANQLVNIVGTGFTGTVSTTGVKIGGTNAPSWIVENDSLIVATVPSSLAAGAQQVVVTNAVGPSTSAVNLTLT